MAPLPPLPHSWRSSRGKNTILMLEDSSRSARLLVAIPQGEIVLRCVEVDHRQGHLVHRLAHLLQPHCCRHLVATRPCNRLPLHELLQDCRCRDDWALPLEDGALALPAR